MGTVFSTSGCTISLKDFYIPPRLIIFYHLEEFGTPVTSPSFSSLLSTRTCAITRQNQEVTHMKPKFCKICRTALDPEQYNHRHIYCEDCGKERDRMIRLESARRYYNKLHTDGKCIRCKQPNSDTTFKTCPECRMKHTTQEFRERRNHREACKIIYAYHKDVISKDDKDSLFYNIKSIRANVGIVCPRIER